MTRSRRRSDRNDLHPAARARRRKTLVGLLMMVGGGGLAISFQPDFTLYELIFSIAFLVWGGILVEPVTFLDLVGKVLDAAPWSHRKS